MSKKHTGRLELTWTDKDKTLLSTGDGKYDYTFVHPSDYRVSEVRLLHLVERIDFPAHEERPAAHPEPTTDNLLISGDAMHALDALAKLPEYADKYLGKVKLVYIDPPFNTGQAFTNYEDNIEHSIWLTMLRDRLRQLKPLLAKDGVIWVHLDDAEVHRCRAVMDEELGAECYLGTVIWQKADGPRNDLPNFSVDHDTLLVYGRTKGAGLIRGERDESLNAIYDSADGDTEPWYDGDPTAPSAYRNQTWVYAIQSPVTGELMYPAKGRCWGTKQSTVLTALSEYAAYEARLLDDDVVRADICGVDVKDVRKGIRALMLAVPLHNARATAEERKSAGPWPEYIIRPKGTLGRKRPQPDTGSNTRTLWFSSDVGHNREAKAEIKALFPGISPFSTPKPERLLRKVIQASTKPGEIVLDCYAGSGTTAAVAQKMGRRWITSELLPDTIEKFTKPRLLKVVSGRDSGGVTTITERVAVGDLPDGLSPAEAQDFNRLLSKVTDSDEPIEIPLGTELAKMVRSAKKRGVSPLKDEESKDLLRLLKMFAADGAPFDVQEPAKALLAKRTRTKEEMTTLWHGGGGFVHLKVGPSMFEETDGIVLLADWATQTELTAAMCAQLEVRYCPDGIFAGSRGSVRYIVIDGLVGKSTVGSVLDQLQEGHIVEVWATQYNEEAADLLRKERPGSRLEAIPDSVLGRFRRKVAVSSPFKNEKTDD